MASEFYTAYKAITDSYITALESQDFREVEYWGLQIDKLNDYLNRYSMSVIDFDGTQMDLNAEAIREILQIDEDVNILHWGLGGGTSGGSTNLTSGILYYDADSFRYRPYTNRLAAGTTAAFYSGIEIPNSVVALDTNALTYNGSFRASGYTYSGVIGRSNSGSGGYFGSASGYGAEFYSQDSYGAVISSDNAGSLLVVSNAGLTGDKDKHLASFVRQESGDYDVTGDLIHIIDNPSVTGDILGKAFYYETDVQKISMNPRISATDVGNAAYEYDTEETLTTADRARWYNNAVDPIIFEGDGSISIPLAASFKINSNAITTTNIPEGTNLYFEEDRVLETILVGLGGGTGAVLASDNILQAFGKVANNVHDPVTLSGASYGLFINGQEIGLGVSGASSTGSLTNTDWNTFNNKQAALGFTPEDAANREISGGYAGLDVEGYIYPSRLRALSINNTFVVADISAMLALDAEVGDVAVVGLSGGTSITHSYILQVLPASSLGSWVEILTPASVISVNGQTGVVVVDCTAIGAVPITRTINGYALNTNISLIYSDVGAEAAIGNPANNDYLLARDIDGTWSWVDPSTIGGSSYTFSNGLTEAGGSVIFGGALTQDTEISSVYNIDFLSIDKRIRLQSGDGIDKVGSVWVNWTGTSYDVLLSAQDGVATNAIQISATDVTTSLDTPVSDNSIVGWVHIDNNKQNTLISGTNIKTINGESLLGSTNIVVGGDTYTSGNLVNIVSDVISIDANYLEGVAGDDSVDYYNLEYIASTVPDPTQMSSCAISENGEYMVYCGDVGGNLVVYISTDQGANWVYHLIESSTYVSYGAFVSISKNGQYIYVGGLGVFYGDTRLYYSANYGVSWGFVNSGTLNVYSSVSVSYNGQYSSYTIRGGNIYVGSNYGGSFSSKAISADWSGISISYTGQYQTAVIDNGYIYVSSDYGNTWSQKGSEKVWVSVSMSSSGQYQTAVGYFEYIYTSSDYGQNWYQRGVTGAYTEACVSDDGSTQYAVTDGGKRYISLDYGVTWIDTNIYSTDYGAALSGNAKYILTSGADGSYSYVFPDSFNTLNINAQPFIPDWEDYTNNGSLTATQGWVANYVSEHGGGGATVMTRDRDTNVSVTYTVTIPAGSKLDSIDVFWVSGSPEFKIGTSAGGDDLAEEQILTSGAAMNWYGSYIPDETIIYFTLTAASGVVNINYDYYENVN